MLTHYRIAQALEQLLEIEQERSDGLLSPSSRCVGLARVGAPNEKIVAGTIAGRKLAGFFNSHMLSPRAAPK